MKRNRRHPSLGFKGETVALVMEHGYNCTAAGRVSFPSSGQLSIF